MTEAFYSNQADRFAGPLFLGVFSALCRWYKDFSDEGRILRQQEYDIFYARLYPLVTTLYLL